MKVLQILPEMNSGGVERGTLEIADFLVAHGHEALVISNGGRQVVALEEAGARHINMPVHRKRLGSLLQVKRLRKVLEREKPDIMHFRSRVPGWIAWLAWRKMDPATRPRLVSTVHGFYSVNGYSAIMTKGERLIAVSNSIREYILKEYPRAPDGNITVIYRGIIPEIYPRGFRPDDSWLATWHGKYPGLEGRKLFLLPGRITRLKGHKDFFRLIAQLKKEGKAVHGLVAGDTHEKKKAYLDELKAHVKDEGLVGDITFLGHRKDVREVMAVSDVVCALSQQPESFGRTVLEALSLGKPVLGYDCGGVGEILDSVFPEGKVPLGDGKILLDRARSILAESPISEVPDGAFTLDTMCRKTLKVYEDLLNSPR